MNILCALGMAAVLSGKPEEVIRHAGALKGAKGRLELAGTTDSGAAVYIDYAHTPDALENVIRAMRPHTRGKLHVLFGCGGDRDSGKRPIMGQIANELADVIYVTDDNPRTEDAAKNPRADYGRLPARQKYSRARRSHSGSNGRAWRRRRFDTGRQRA